MAQITAGERSQYLQRWTSLQTERSTWLARYMDISAFLLPFSGRFFITDRNRGDKSFNNIYDSSGTRALRTLAAGMMSGMTSPARPWFRLTTSDPQLMQHQPVKEWLAAVTLVIQSIFHRSNTYRSLHTMYEELGGFGTAVSIISDDFKNVIHHTTLTAGEYAIACDNKGDVTTMYREFEMTVSQLIMEFGRENVSTTVANLYDRGNLDDWIPVLHLVEPRVDRDSRMKDAKNMPFKSVYVEQSTVNGNKVLRESGMKEFSVLAPRWSAKGGNIYGDCPAMEALGDTKQLQHEQLRKGQCIDYQTKPPLQVPTSLMNKDVDMLPGGITYYDPSAPTGSIKSMFEVDLNMQYLLDDIRDVRSRIDKAFYADLFQMISNMEGVQPRNQLEISARQEEKLLMLGPVLERLNNEMLEPKIEITFAKALAAGILPPPPPEMLAQDVNIQFVSMLAQAQRAVGTGNVDRLLGTIMSIAPVKPDIMDKLDTDQLVDHYADLLGTDPSLIVADDKVVLLRAARAKQMQQQQAMAMAPQAADTAKTLSQTPTDGNTALDAALKGLTGYSGGGGG